MASLLDFLRPQQAQQPGAMQQQGGGLMGLLDPSVALPAAAALLGNQGNSANFGNAFGAMGEGMAQQRELQAQTAQKNKTLEFLRQNSPELAAAIEGGMPVNEAWGSYMDSRKAQKPTATLQEYQFAKEQGYPGSFMDYQIDQKKAGATNVSVGGGKYGTIPQGYELVEGPNGATMRAIPGGPEDMSKKNALAAGQRDVASGTVTDAASKARTAANNRQLGGFGQGIASSMPWTQSAEVQRQVEVLKAQATVQNLNAMRQSSPTGGALGSVTAPELKLLSDQAGALDPSSPTFQRDLDNYELTLLQIIHGPQEGQRVFEETRQLGSGGGQADGMNTTSTGATWRVK